MDPEDHPPPLTIYDLWAFALTGTAGKGRHPAFNESVALATAVVSYFTGTDWMNRNVALASNLASPLRVDPTTPDFYEKITRFIDWGEVFFNLQEVPGFNHLMTRLRQNDNVDGVLGELELGRMLYLRRIPFSYIVPSGLKGGRNHDIDIKMPDGTPVCADAKCKIESTNFNATTVRSTLQSAREQLPGDMPGFIFVKVPPRWLQESGFGETLSQVTFDFFRGTRRVVSVKYFSSIFQSKPGVSALLQACSEVSNPRNRFDPDRNWDLFPAEAPDFAWDGIPAHWQTFFRFPDGRIR